MNDARPDNAAFDPRPAADLLAAAWLSGTPLVELPESCRPRTLAEGYDLQDRLLGAMGEPAFGWKLGVGSPRAMAKGGLARPLVGQLLASRCHPSGATVTVRGNAPVTLEFEVAFILGRDVAPGDSLASPFDAVASTCVTFEFVRSRFVNRLAVGWPSFVGDSVGFEALVVGAAAEYGNTGGLDIERITRDVVVHVDGAEAARAMTGDDLSSPLVAMTSLFAHARERGATLRKGEIVSTGAIAKPFDITGDAHVTAQFPGGELSVRLQRRT